MAMAQLLIVVVCGCLLTILIPVQPSDCQSTSSTSSSELNQAAEVASLIDELRQTLDDAKIRSQHTRVNIALNRPATQMNTYLGIYVASWSTDGNLTTLSCCVGQGSWWQVDLGATYQIDTVVVHSDVNKRYPYRFTNFAVILSNVPATIAPPVYPNNPIPCGLYPGDVPVGATVAVACPFTAPRARYVTLQGTKDALCMFEVEVYARD